jgi:hypothetical protein
MSNPVTTNNRRSRFIYFFPFQLLLLHIKKNTFLLLLWLFLFGIITGVVAVRVGVPQQFLIPEYLGVTGVVSFGILGFAVGGFISGFNLYTYIRHGYRFPFIATLNKPFQKFCLNNFIIPALFIITYCICSARYQMSRELVSGLNVLLNLSSFVLMAFVFQLLSYIYFVYTNKSASNFGKSEQKTWADEQELDLDEEEEEEAASKPGRLARWLRRARRSHGNWYVETYIFSFTKISLARDCGHYDKRILDKVFDQNHVNASRFELALILSFIIIGSLRSYEALIIPAAASLMLFFTVLIMLFSAIHSRMRGWTLTIIMFFLAGFNHFYEDLRIFRQQTKAYGMNYDVPPAPYDLNLQIPTPTMTEADSLVGVGMLENWKNKIQKQTGNSQKPKLIILNHSGGGTRSAYWNMLTMAYVDSILNGKLLDHSVMMTGASGGMFGAAYLRELKLRQAWGEEVNLYDRQYAENMAKDLLNPIMMSAVTNDWLVRYQRIEDGDYKYSKDRATAFEEQFQRNTDYIFNRRIRDYSEYEFKSFIPMMVLSPTISRDGRRMLISSQPISYLTSNFPVNGNSRQLPEDVEFRRMFEKQDANNLQFLSALRMSATFPYVLPMTTLPSDPPIDMVDAGVRDNYGLKTTMQFIFTFKDWINKNTSGVVVVQIRDLPKNKSLEEHHPSFFGKFSAPVGGIYGNLTKTQEYNNEQAFRFLKGWFNGSVSLVTFELQQDKDTQVSLNWHLTKSEKLHIQNALQDSYFQSEVHRLVKLLRED